jgi:hypothetical protein
MAQNIANVTGIAPEAREPVRLLALQLLRMADAEWREALRLQHEHCGDTLDHAFRDWAAPDREYPFDHECPGCAPLRALLSEGPGQ